MPLNRQKALALVESPAFDEVFDDYEAQIFAQWLSCTDEDELYRLHMKAQVAREVKQQLKNTAVDINGTDTAH